MTTQNDAEQAVTEQRPLTATQSRNAMKLATNDYQQVMSDLNVHERDEIIRRKAEYREQMNVAQEQEAARKARKAKKKFLKTLEQIEADHPGIKVSVGYGHWKKTQLNMSVSWPSIEQGYQRIQKEVKEEVDLVRAIALQKFREIERRILRASIDAPVETILATLPSMQELLQEAYEQRQIPEALPSTTQRSN